MTGRVLLALALAASLAPAAARAQERVCDFSSVGRTQQVEQNGTLVILLHDPFEVRCTDGAVLRANAGTLDRVSRDLVLNGNVFFRDPDRELTADNATYNSAVGRLYATGNVVFTNRAEGSTIRGPELEYYRPLPDRPEARILARQRPHLVLRPREADSEAEPLELDADEVTIYGQDQLNAVGSVVITRTDMRATAWEAQYSEAEGRLELRRDARIVSEEYSLSGQLVRARMDDGVIQHVWSQGDAELAGRDLTVQAPEVQLFFADSLLQRAVARSGEAAAQGQRAVATSRNFRIEGDSLDATLPGQQLEQVVAIGRARGEAVDTAATADSLPVPTAAAAAAELTVPDALARADSAAPAGPAAAAAMPGLIDRDWILGDTLIGHFARADSVDGAERSDTTVVLERIVARGNAQSLYRVEPQDSTAAGRGVNFLSGDVIELNFEQGELALAEVTGLRRGLYLDPVPRSSPPAGGEGPAQSSPPVPAPRPNGSPDPREGDR